MRNFWRDEIRNTCVSIRVVRKWICSELFVRVRRDLVKLEIARGQSGAVD